MSNEKAPTEVIMESLIRAHIPVRRVLLHHWGPEAHIEVVLLTIGAERRIEFEYGTSLQNIIDEVVKRFIRNDH